MCCDLGVGPAPLPLKGLTPGALAAGMRDLLQQLPRYAAAAARVAAELSQEDGLGAALASVCATLPARRLHAGEREGC